MVLGISLVQQDTLLKLIAPVSFHYPLNVAPRECQMTRVVHITVPLDGLAQGQFFRWWVALASLMVFHLELLQVLSLQDGGVGTLSSCLAGG